MPNTRAAHDLVSWAAETGTGCRTASLIDRLLTGYFLDGEDIGNPDALERIGLACGLDSAGLAEHLAVSRRDDNMAIRRSLQAKGVRA
ncbi:DSBA oxidoreductase [Caballeronia arvi]|uniref:DSBA oxidoreductase n=1 Tax=Caballeronia arvi TaxID=1777135 RepID=A0A158L1X6_9BURK|nr:hypothetical protein [Caballeronia arvi]SAL86651.1 DSBA oxidoreductase [Caballeronia arvi]